MFDIGFSEILLSAVVALVVLGSDKLPGAVRVASLWVGRLRRTIGDVRAEFERGIGADDIHRELHEAQLKKSFESGRQQLRALQDDLRHIEHDLVQRDDVAPLNENLNRLQPVTLSVESQLSPGGAIPGAI